MSKLRKMPMIDDKVYWLVLNQPNATGVVTSIRKYNNVRTLVVQRSDGVIVQIASDKVHLI